MLVNRSGGTTLSSSFSLREIVPEGVLVLVIDLSDSEVAMEAEIMEDPSELEIGSGDGSGAKGRATS